MYSRKSQVEGLVLEAPVDEPYIRSDLTESLLRKSSSETPGYHTAEIDSRDGCDLGRAGSERLEGTIAPPQVGSDFDVDPTVLNGICSIRLAVD